MPKTTRIFVIDNLTGVRYNAASCARWRFVMARPLKRDLTTRQQEVFQWIKSCIAEDGVPPTIREVAQAFGIKSSSAFDFIKVLERKGRLTRRKQVARALVVERRIGKRVPNPVRVLILGSIAAGAPILAVEDPSETITVDGRLGRGRDLYALRVEGDSMKDADILDGDVVIIRRQDTADDGDIIVALIDDEATLKRFYRDGDGVRLQPANRKMAPIHVRSGEFRIQEESLACSDYLIPDTGFSTKWVMLWTSLRSKLSGLTKAYCRFGTTRGTTNCCRFKSPPFAGAKCSTVVTL